jgi:hypothetical protein
MSAVRRGLLVGGLGLLSAVGGLLLIGIGIITRQERAVAAGRRRFHGSAFERRWIPDPAERQHHSDVVAERLDLPADAHVDLTTAASRLGVSVTTIRRRVKRGELQGVYAKERLVGVVLPSE